MITEQSTLNKYANVDKGIRQCSIELLENDCVVHPPVWRFIVFPTTFSTRLHIEPNAFELSKSSFLPIFA